MQKAKKSSGSRGAAAYKQWMESIGVPIHQGHHVEDLRTAELAWWEDRKANAAFLYLKGMEGVSEARVMEIPPGQAMAPMKLAIGELVYVLGGQGLTAVWNEEGGPRKTFEWGEQSLFHIPRHCHHQIFNGSGDKPARLLHYNYLPVAMSVVPDPDFFFNNPYQGNIELVEDDDLFADATEVKTDGPDGPPIGVYWLGNFFPDLRHWNRLASFKDRGAGGSCGVHALPRCRDGGPYVGVRSRALQERPPPRPGPGHRHP